MENIIQNRVELEHKFKQLNELKITLKSEFFGIDYVIDQMIESISPWYLFPELQLRPTVINLWGLTGVGKTSLIKRIVVFLELESKYMSVDMGNLSGEDRHSLDLNTSLIELKKKNDNCSFIFTLDEFQHLRTVDKGNEQSNNSSTRTVWNLLDSGKIVVYEIDSYSIGRINSELGTIKYLLGLGIQVENGVITEGLGVYKKTMAIAESNSVDEKKKEISFFNRFQKKDIIDSNNESTKEYRLVDKYLYDDILDITNSKFETSHDVEQYLRTLNGVDTYLFLSEIIEKARAPKELDCSKSLIFVVGNLDEAYSISDDLNPDVSADLFYNESLKITLLDVKEALKSRFRIEQIARLGNNHIIYPALSSSAYLAILGKELLKIMKQSELRGLCLEFDKSVSDFLLSEGVFPTQGARPLLTTIDQYLKPCICIIYQEIFEQNINVNKVVLKYHNDQIDYVFYNGLDVVHRKGFVQKGTLNSLRKSLNDDQQTITAVHEAGHVVLSLVLQNIVPDIVCSVTAFSKASGFVKRSFSVDFISKMMLKKELAVLLGGIEAERLIFGTDHITLGSSSDIEKATRLLGMAIRENGFGTMNSHARIPSMLSENYYFDKKSEMNDMIADELEKATVRAVETLTRYKSLLLAIAKYLSIHSSMDNAKIIEVVEKNSDLDIELLLNTNQGTFYKDLLNNHPDQTSVTQNLAHHKSFQLNRDSNKGL